MLQIHIRHGKSGFSIVAAPPLLEERKAIIKQYGNVKYVDLVQVGE